MTTPLAPPVPASSAQDSERDQISQNLEAVLDFYTREDQKISPSQRMIERLSLWLGKPAYLGCILLGVFLWILSNLILARQGRPAFDPPPFFWLQGLVGLGALLTATVVLAKQNRFSRLAEQRAHPAGLFTHCKGYQPPFTETQAFMQACKIL